MKRIKRFFMSAVLLASVNVFLRAVAVSFNAYVSSKIGAESMGLFTLVMSVYGMTVTLATSGVNLAAVRLTAERLAPLSDSGATRREYKRCVAGVVSRCAVYSLLFSIPTGSLLYFFAPGIGKHLLGDVRCVSSLRVLAMSLPAISLTSALSGYFTGVRKVYKNAASAIIEQGMKIILTSTALTLSVPYFTDRVEYSCLAVVGGAAVAEGLSLAVNIIMYILDSKRPADGCIANGGAVSPKTKLIHIASVAMPVALGAYARQGLSTAEHLSIPWGMRRSGLGAEASLAAYGVLQGMVFPLILFPSAVLSSAAGLLVPELAESKALDNTHRIRRIVGAVFTAAIVFSVGCAAVFFAFSDFLGMSVYGNEDAASYIRATSALVPVMYFDIAVDCMLKGLGEQVHSMRINIIDSAVSLVLVLILVPAFGINGYIVSVYVCEILNCVLSVKRLHSVTGVGLDFKTRLLPPVLCAAFCITVTALIPAFSGSDKYALQRLVLCAAIYIMLVYVFGKKKNLPNTVENS